MDHDRIEWYEDGDSHIIKMIYNYILFYISYISLYIIVFLFVLYM